jgi:hypothetical protein
VKAYLGFIVLISICEAGSFEKKLIDRDASADGGHRSRLCLRSSETLQTEGPPQKNNACDRGVKQQRLQIADQCSPGSPRTMSNTPAGGNHQQIPARSPSSSRFAY